MKLAKESYPFLLPLLGFFLISFVLKWTFLAGLFLVLLAFVAYFFRDPNRKTPDEPAVIFSPADGTVTKVQTVEIDGVHHHHVVIFLSPLNVHINRIPFAGKVVSVQHTPGAFHAAYRDDIANLNERTETRLETEKGPMRIIQIAGFVARRIVNYLQPDQVVKAGDKFGMIKFSSRTDLIFPIEARVLVHVGDKLEGGVTRLAAF
ncbi:MAG: phosphatidylserine decarboxylase [Candidatus Margulisiibacteriota bacterium]